MYRRHVIKMHISIKSEILLLNLFICEFSTVIYLIWLLVYIEIMFIFCVCPLNNLIGYIVI